MAQQRELPVMKESWVHSVWEAMSGKGVEARATDDQFKSHICPVFHNQVVCISQLSKNEKNSIKKLVEENGKFVSIELHVTTGMQYNI